MYNRHDEILESMNLVTRILNTGILVEIIYIKLFHVIFYENSFHIFVVVEQMKLYISNMYFCFQLPLLTCQKWVSANNCLYRIPSLTFWPICTFSPSPSSCWLSSRSPSSRGHGIRLSLQMLCKMQQATITWHALSGDSLISPCRTWNRLFSCPMPLSTMLLVFLWAL